MTFQLFISTCILLSIVTYKFHQNYLEEKLKAFVMWLDVFLIKVFEVLKHDKSKEELSDLCFSIARNLRSGQSLNASIETAEKTNYIDMSKLDNNSLQVKMLHATQVIANSMGGSSSKVFDKMGESMLFAKELKDETNSSLAQVRLSTYVISALPICLVLLSFLMGSKASLFLITNSIGWVCLSIGVSLEIAGIYWMKHQVNKSIGRFLS